MPDAADRHPVRTLLIFILLGLVIINGARLSFASRSTPARTWPLFVWGFLSLWALASSLLVRTRPEFQLNRTLVLLALAFTPIILGLAAVAAGAALWILWVALAFAFGLAAWWVRDASTTLKQSTGSDQL